MIVWALLLAYTLVSAGQQGIIVWLFREYVPASRQDWINGALHILGPVLYVLFVLPVLRAYGHYTWAGAAVITAQATLARWLLFDLGINLARNWFNHREGRPPEPVFSVGTSAGSDRLTRWIAARLGLYPGAVRVGLLVLGFALSLALTLVLPGH